MEIGMKLCVVVVLALGFLATAAASAQDAVVKDEMKKLQGTWKVVALEGAGEKASEEYLKKKEMRFLVKQDRLSFSGQDDLQPYRLDPAAKPKAIDFLGKAAKVINKGIYEVEGDT